ncbi:MAG: hypothetical protein PHH79_08655 [Aminobacterium colombiense]|nr:hypothetical protein [Aminobacterium colombiense]
MNQVRLKGCVFFLDVSQEILIYSYDPLGHLAYTDKYQGNSGQSKSLDVHEKEIFFFKQSG